MEFSKFIQDKVARTKEATAYVCNLSVRGQQHGILYSLKCVVRVCKHACTCVCQCYIYIVSLYY